MFMNTVLSWTNSLFSFVLVAALFATIYKVLPSVRLAWRDVTIGSLVTALLFTAGKFAIGVYIGNSGLASTYGAAGSVVLILIWVYYSAQILLYGAEFTRAFAYRYGSFAAAAKAGALALQPQSSTRYTRPGHRM
jgi:membrane protein